MKILVIEDDQGLRQGIAFSLTSGRLPRRFRLPAGRRDTAFFAGKSSGDPAGPEPS